MAYEKGSYLQELKEEHQRGEHREDEHPQCPVCESPESSEGFASQAEYNKAVMDTALELEEVLDDHRQGEHRNRPHPGCLHPGCSTRE